MNEQVFTNIVNLIKDAPNRLLTADEAVRYVRGMMRNFPDTISREIIESAFEIAHRPRISIDERRRQKQSLESAIVVDTIPPQAKSTAVSFVEVG